MAETGWPLIPREVLPAPVPLARPERRPLPGVAHPDLGRQLSIFGAETTEPSPADLAGLLAGPAHLGRMGGTARVSVRVDAAWRVHVLVNELVRRGLVVTWSPVNTEPPKPDQIPDPDGTAYPPPDADIPPDQHADPENAPEYDDEPASAVIGGTHRSNAPPPPDPDEPRAHADQTDAQAGAPANARAGVSTAPAGVPVDPPPGDDHPADDGEVPADSETGEPPEIFFEVRTAYSSRLSGLARAWPAAADQLFLSGPRLRLWVAAAGRPLAGGYALGLDPRENPAIVDAALVRAGLAGTVSDDGRYYLILGRKRLARLAELVGDRPKEAPTAI
jgi:hypothetical protein